MLVDHPASPPLLTSAKSHAKQHNVTIVPASTQTTTTSTTTTQHNNNNNSNSNNNNNNNSHHNNSQHTASAQAHNFTTTIKTNEKCPPHASTASFETTGKARSQKNLHDLLLETLDILVSCLVVAPCVISYWRGTWELMGVLIFPSNVPLSAFMSFLIGGFGHLLFTMTQSYFRDHIHPDKRRLTYYMVSRLYTAVFGIVCVNMWRGSWILCDWLTSADSLIIIIIVTLVAVMFLIATRTVRNLGAAPYTVTMDHKSDYFDVGTMFRIPGFHQPGLYVLDSLFSVFVIGTLVVIAWRGLWGIMDLTLYTDNKPKSAWGSLIIGYITVFASFIIHPLVRLICRYIDGLLRLFVCDVFYFMTFFGAVNAWRGIWTLLDVYLYPDNKILSYWLTHVIPFLILAALKCSNSILVRGVFIDAEGTDGECVDIPINYIRLHFQRERVKKQEHSSRYYSKYTTTHHNHHHHHYSPYDTHAQHQQQQHHHLTKNMEMEAHEAFIEKPLKAATTTTTTNISKTDAALLV